MFNEQKQQRLNELSDSEYKDLRTAITMIDEVIPRLTGVDYRLFESDTKYNKSKHGNAKKARRLNTKRRRANADKNQPAYQRLAQDFLHAMAKLREILDFYPFSILPLYLQILADAIYRCGLSGFPVEQQRFDQHEVNELNACIDYIQYLLNDPGTIREIKRIERNHRNQVQSIEAYIRRLFYCYARLQAIRIDLGYQQGVEISYGQVLQHCQQLTRYLRDKHDGNAHAGYIWKLEYGLRKGYHFHMMIFMDGSKVQQSILHGKMIGDHWNKAITNGLGTSFNCNGKMREYRDCGIGRVDYYDLDKTNSLLSASRYLTKHDPYIEIMQEVESQRAWENGNSRLSWKIMKGRVFGKGGIPMWGKHYGRPRSRGFISML